MGVNEGSGAAGEDSRRQTGVLSLGGCADIAAQTLLVQSQCGGWYLHTHEGNTTAAEAAAPHTGSITGKRV